MSLPRKTVLASCSGLTALGLALTAVGCSSGDSFCETATTLLAPSASYVDSTVNVGSPLRHTPTVTQNGPITQASLVGGSLPPGTTLLPDGTISGTPTAPGIYALQVQLCNAQAACLTLPTRITVLPEKDLALSYVTPRYFALGTAIPAQPPTLSFVMPGWDVAYTLASGALPAGLSLDPKTGVITGTPTTPGVYTFTVRATNGSRSAICDPVTYFIEVTAPLTVDYVDRTFRQGTQVGAGTILPAIGNATPGVPVTLSLVAGSLPTGLSLDPATGTITGTAQVPGIYTFTIRATNGSRSAVTRVVTFIVEPAADLALNYDNQVFLEGTTILPGRFMPSLSHAIPGLPVTYALASGTLPPGLSLDPATGAISGTATQAGGYTFTIRATSGSRSATTGNVVYLVENTKPLAVSYANRTMPAGTAMTGQPVVNNLTFGVGTNFSLASGQLPPGLSLNVAAGTISGTPTTPGVYVFQVKLSNGSRTTTTTAVTYTVEHAAPLTLGYTIPVLTVGTDIGSRVPTAGPLTPGVTTTYGITGLPPGLGFNTSTGTFTGTPTTAGYYPVTVTVTNGTRTTSTTFNIEVVPAGALGLAYTNQTFVVNTAIANQSPSAQTNFTPGAPTSYSATGLPAGLSISSTTGVISGTPQAAAEGIRAFTVTVVNGSRQYTTHVTYTINHEGTLTLGYPSNLSFTTATSIGNQDPSTVLNVTSGVPVSYASADLPAGLSLDANTGRITGNAPVPGTYTFHVTLTNGTLPGGSPRTAEATVVYLATYVEAMTLAYQTSPVEIATAASVGTNNATVTYGTPGTTTTFQVTSVNGTPSSTMPTGMVLNADGSITGTAGVAPGIYDITITATNGQRNANTTVRYIVTPVAALTVTYADKTLTVGDTVTTGNTPSLGNVTPGLSTTYAAVNPALLPNGLSVDPTTGAITGTASAAGTFTFQIRATHGARTATDTVVYTVQAAVPTSLNYTPVTVSEAVLITPLDPNPTGGTPTTYALQNAGTNPLPSGLTLNPSTGQITGTPGSAGTYTITVRGSNTSGHVDQTFTITVVALPSVSSFEANPTLVPRGSASSLSAFFSGPTGTTATLADNQGGSYGTVLSGSLSTGILNQADGTTITYTLTVSNGLGGVVTRNAQVTVYEPANKLEVTLTPDTPVTGEVTDNASPLDGVKVDIPAVATCSTGSLMVIPETLAAAGLSGKLPSNGETVLSPVYNLTASVGYPFRAPITVSLPYDATEEAALGANDLVVPFYWEPTYQKWVAVGLKGYGTYSATGPVTRNRVTFTTLLPGRYILLAFKGLTPTTIAPTFSMASDTLSLGNQGEYENPGGSSLGISAFQAWYQSMRKATNGNVGLKTLIPADAAIQAPLASRLAGGSLNSWNQLYSQTGYTLTVNQTARALITGLKATGQPQLFLMKGVRTVAADTAVAMLVTGYNSTNGTFNVVDPNFPSDDLTLTWNSAGAGTFSAYSREIVYSPAPSAWAFEGQPSVHRLSDYEILLDGMKSTPRWKRPPFAQITADAVTDASSGTGFSAVPDGGSVTVSHYSTGQTTFTASISGTVLDGDQTANYILSSQNGGLRSPSTLTAGAYTLNPFTLTNPYGTTVMLETAPNACDPTFTHSGFMSFTAKQDNLPDFFKNLCFEDNTTNGWALSSRLQTNNSTYAGSDITPTPSNWSVVVDAATDVNSGTLSLPKVLSGAKALRVNTDRTGGQLGLAGAPASKVVQEVEIPDVNGADPKLEFYWAACMQDAGHAPADQPYAKIVVEIIVGANAGLKFIDRHFVAGDSYTGWKNGTGQWRVIPWQKVSINGLKAYKGQKVRLSVEAAGCVPTGHAGYAYVDAMKCE